MSNIDNFRITAGEDRTLTMIARNRSQAVVDITGATVDFRMAKRIGDVSIITKTGTVTDGPAGTFTVTLTDTDTDELSGNYVYRVYHTISGDTSTLNSGRIVVDEGIPLS